MRYERKYRVEGCTLQEVLHVIRMHRASFREAFPPRYINSIYLDTYTFGSFEDNLAGISKRAKQRIRWYGSNLQLLQKPVLEIKTRNNLIGQKRLVPLNDFSIGHDFSFEKFRRENEWLKNTEVTPTVLVRYKREYYLSMNQKVRLTVDYDLQYLRANDRLNFQSFPVKDPSIILELKYEQTTDQEFDYISQDFPFRMTKNSKYVSAILACY